MQVFENFNYKFGNTKLNIQLRWKRVDQLRSSAMYTNMNGEVISVENARVQHHNPNESKIIQCQIVNAICKKKAAVLVIKKKKTILK